MFNWFEQLLSELPDETGAIKSIVETSKEG